MKILEHRALPGPNVHSPHPTIHMLLDIEPYADTPTDELPHLQEALLSWLPGLMEHRCSEGRPGGLAKRLRRGTWLAHVTEHVAIELQCMAGVSVGFGKTRMTERHGIYTVAYRYRTEEAGLAAGRHAVAIVEAAAAGRPADVEGAVQEIRRLHRRDALGPSTRAIVMEARRRGIPVLRLNEASFIQLGHGAKQRRIQASLTGATSCLGAEIADDKMRTKRILADAGIPVPAGEVATSVEEASAIAVRLGYPVAVKPIVGNHGRGITTDVHGPDQLVNAVAAAQKVHAHVIVEQMLDGGDFRVLVVDHRFVAAAQRVPASVVAQGRRTVRQLIEEANSDPRRGEGHESELTLIDADAETERMLARQGLTLDDVPIQGTTIRLKGIANLSSGGSAIDVTDEVHPRVRRMCERISRLIGLDVMGIDIVAPSLRQPLTGRVGIVEVNAAPGLRMHTHPTLGRPRAVAQPIIDMLFPEGDGRIPIVAVTGTNGKTTTVQLVARILEHAGGRVGVATTDGVRIGDERILAGDYAGPHGARALLQDPWVDHAVIEVARGGILRRGLGYDMADVGILLNVAADHIGEGGIESLDDLADVKSVVVENLRPDGWAVLNAADPRVLARRERIHGQVVLFAKSPLPELERHVAAGGLAVTVVQDEIVVHRPQGDLPVIPVRDIPLLMEGVATFNLDNSLAAVAAGFVLGVPVETIRDALASFAPTPAQLPGRLNLFEVGGRRVLVDYGHNVAALAALAPVVRKLRTKRGIAVANGSGNRRDEDLMAFGRALAGLYDEVLLCDPDPRGRAPGETMDLVWRGATEVLPPDRVQRFDSEPAAIAAALAMAQPGDLVVVQAEDVHAALAQVQGHRAATEARIPPLAMP